MDPKHKKEFSYIPPSRHRLKSLGDDKHHPAVRFKVVVTDAQAMDIAKAILAQKSEITAKQWQAVKQGTFSAKPRKMC